MIKNFKDEQAKAIYEGRHPGKGFPQDLIRAARRKLIIMAEARLLEDLRVPPGNELELLKGDRAGQHSIRINRQWRICFTWADGAEAVEIIDYH